MSELLFGDFIDGVAHSGTFVEATYEAKQSKNLKGAELKVPTVGQKHLYFFLLRRFSETPLEWFFNQYLETESPKCGREFAFVYKGETIIQGKARVFLSNSSLQNIGYDVELSSQCESPNLLLAS